MQINKMDLMKCTGEVDYISSMQTNLFAYPIFAAIPLGKFQYNFKDIS